MSSYLQKKIIITGQNDAAGRIYVTGYKEEDADTQIGEKSVNIDDGDNNGIEEQVDTIKRVFGSTQTDQEDSQKPEQEQERARTEAKAQPPTQPPTPARAPTPAPTTDDTTTADVTTPAEAPIDIDTFNAMQIPWRVSNGYNNQNVLDYIKWIKNAITEKNRNYNIKELKDIVNEYDKLIIKVKKGSITQDELNSFFDLTKQLKKRGRRGGKTKKLRAFRKKTLRNQRKSKKRLGSRKNIR